MSKSGVRITYAPKDVEFIKMPAHKTLDFANENISYSHGTVDRVEIIGGTGECDLLFYVSDKALMETCNG